MDGLAAFGELRVQVNWGWKKEGKDAQADNGLAGCIPPYSVHYTIILSLPY
jgi:hypothetical protein